MSENRHQEYEPARELMEAMVTTSQKPGEGNTQFVETMSDYLKDKDFSFKTVADPEMSDRSLLIVEFGDPDGEQALAAISHSDVVGVEGQDWHHDPHTLREADGNWYGRGVCDTHGSGVAMLLAGSRPDVRSTLEENNKKVSVVFTYDEEATSPELSMRGARMAAGLLGVEGIVSSKYFIAGEPTEFDGYITPMRSHKGRFLSHFIVEVDHSGHVSDLVQNAFVSGSGIVHQIGEYAKTLRYGSSRDEEAKIYRPPHSTAQVSAAEVKSGDYSTTPARAKFTVDMRTLPDVHDLRVRELTDLIETYPLDEGSKLTLDIVKDAPGSVTSADSVIVAIAEEASGRVARGFNGGDEGRILRLYAGKEGVTIGPGELSYAHMPNEQVSIESVLNATNIYSNLFSRAVLLDNR